MKQGSHIWHVSRGADLPPELAEALAAFKTVALAWILRQPADVVNEGPRLLVGRVSHEKLGNTTEDIRAADRVLLRGVLDTGNARARRHSHGRRQGAAGLLLDAPEFIGMDYPVAHVGVASGSLELVPVPSAWAVYGRARWAKVNRERVKRLKDAVTPDDVKGIVPADDLTEGVAVFGGLAIGTTCTAHEKHEAEVVFVAVRDGDGWLTLKSKLPGDPPADGSFGVAVDWASEDGLGGLGVDFEEV